MSDYIGRPCGSVCGIPEDAHQTEEHPWVAAREPAGAGLRTAAKTLSLALSEFLISLWTGNTTARRRDLDAAHAALRAALASPAEPGLDVEARLLLNSALDHDDYVLIHRDDWSRFRTALEALEALP